MQRKILLFLFVFSSLLYKATAAETEPNDTKAQANVLALNGNNTGAIGTTTDVDWWRITTNGDGKLDITITISNGVYMWCELYDNNGTTLLANGYTLGTTTVSKDGLATGAYFIRLVPYYAGQMPVYTVSNTLTKPTQANDAEPNDSKAQAIDLPLNASKTGHVNYYFNNKKDSSDWYKVTTTADGRLRLTMASANGQNVWAYLYDNNGTTLLASGYTSGTAVVVNKDGLAAGTYYVRVNTYYTSEWAPYTLADSLFTPTEPNNTEPDSTRALAKTLPLNSSVQGHINYYYNNHRDSVDWYKVNVNADGRLRLTMKSGNGQNVWAYLFDNNATTQLAAGYTSGEAVVVNKDGLAAGTYYVRVNTYYNTEWAPYTLSDSLFKATPNNDTEPNNSKTQARVLAPNTTVTGHTNYYYNLKKDTTDWYSLTTTADGMITINIQSHNGQNVWAYLFDNDGTTVLAAAYTTSTTSYSFDGLKAGTYYVRVNTYYTGEWAPYTLTNTVTAYTNANDKEPNDYFKTAKTLPSNGTGTGHVNFYYNGSKDAVDYHKINYTGSGNLTLLFQLQNRLKFGSATYTWFQVFSDTAAAPIYSNYITSTSGDINFTTLAQGYYYIKVFMYYNGTGADFASYSIKNTYVQGNKATVKTQSYSTTPVCDSQNVITYKLGKSKPPYKVQLYRFGLAYGSPASTNTTTITFDSLPAGRYFATAFGDGATGNAFGRSDTVTIMPAPASTSTTAIKSTQARLNWAVVTCADYDTILYRKQGTPTWSGVAVPNTGTFLLKNLTPSTTYEWQVAAIDSLNKMKAISAFTPVTTFTTTATGLIAGTEDESAVSASVAKLNNNTGAMVSPNPASHYFTIRYNTVAKDKLLAVLYSANGKQAWASGMIEASALNGKQVLVNQLAAGLYYLKITNQKGEAIGTIKVSVTK